MADAAHRAVQRRRRLHRADCAARHSRHRHVRRCVRRARVRPQRPLFRGAAEQPGRGFQLGSESSLRVRRADRPRAAGAGLQHDARRRREPDPRAAQRPHLRVSGRRSRAGGHAGRPADDGRKERARHLRHQALCHQRPGDRAQYRQRRDLEAGDARVGPAGVSDRHPRRAAGRGDVLLQPRQRRLLVRKRLPAAPVPQNRAQVPGLCAVGLGRYALDRESLARRTRQ